MKDHRFEDWEVTRK